LAEDVLKPLNEVENSPSVELKLLAPRLDRSWDFVKLRGRENENDVGWWFFDRFEQRIEGLTT
jgi:hypothetical protein